MENEPQAFKRSVSLTVSFDIGLIGPKNTKEYEIKELIKREIYKCLHDCRLSNFKYFNVDEIEVVKNV